MPHMYNSKRNEQSIQWHIKSSAVYWCFMLFIAAVAEGMKGFVQFRLYIWTLQIYMTASEDIWFNIILIMQWLVQPSVPCTSIQIQPFDVFKSTQFRGVSEGVCLSLSKSSPVKLRFPCFSQRRVKSWMDVRRKRLPSPRRLCCLNVMKHKFWICQI